MVVPGHVAAAAAVHDPGVRDPHVRLSFSHEAPEVLREGVRRMAEVLRRKQERHPVPS